MLLSAVSVLVVVLLSSKVPEGLINYPVYAHLNKYDKWLHHKAVQPGGNFNRRITQKKHNGTAGARVRYCTWENKRIILDIDCPTETSNWLWPIRETSKIPTPFKALQAGETVR
jgi:hypothetical protein